MSESNLSGDRYFDLSLRLLTIFVLFSLACCVAFLVHNLLGSAFNRKDDGSAAQSVAPAPAPAPPAVARPAPPDEVLMDPHRTFRCVEKGRVSFSDHACDAGAEQILPLNPPPAAPAAGGQGAPPAGAASERGGR